MNIAVQLVVKETGERSPVMTGDRIKLVETFSSTCEKPEEYLVFVVAEQLGEEWQYSQCPIFQLDNFISMFKAE